MQRTATVRECVCKQPRRFHIEISPPSQFVYFVRMQDENVTVDIWLKLSGLDLVWVGAIRELGKWFAEIGACLLYTSPSPRDATLSRMPSSA